MERADRDHRHAADALNGADIELNRVKTEVKAGEKRLAELGVPDDETERSLRVRIADMEAAANGYKKAIDTAEKALNDLKLRLERSGAAAGESEKQLASLKKEGERLETEFAARLREEGFAGEREYRLAKRPESVINDIERRLKEYGERKKSLTDQVSSLEEKLARHRAKTEGGAENG